jgi:hypothetical protein
MVRETTNAGMLGQLVRFLAALTANSVELTHLEGARARLEKLVSEAQAIAHQQAALVASKQEASKRFGALLNESLRMATGIQKMLQEHYGLRAEKMAEFGFQPFRGRPRRSEKPEEAKAPPPAPTAAKPTAPKDA